MASLLYSYYLKATKIGGVKARTRLSVLTKITSMQASTMPDDPKLIQIFEEAMKVIYKEFEENANVKKQNVYFDSFNPLDVEYLRKHIEIFCDLIAQRWLLLSDFEAACKRITELIADAIEVERVSIWLYDEHHKQIECKDLFIRSSREHQKGYVLMTDDYPNYFSTIQRERTVAAKNAHTDPRTCEFSANYLSPLGINSMLDIPIWANGNVVGIVCHEHVGPFREWTKDEENFAYIIGNILGMLIEPQKNQQ